MKIQVTLRNSGQVVSIEYKEIFGYILSPTPNSDAQTVVPYLGRPSKFNVSSVGLIL